MIWYFTPYSFEKRLFDAYDAYMQLVHDPNDWVCLCDGDAAFLLSDFGHQMKDYIEKYPTTGLFVCYASRSPYGHQMKKGLNPESDSIKYIYDNTVKMHQQDHLKVAPVNQRICGPILLIKKATWVKYRDVIANQSKKANIQSIDTAISDALTKAGEKILLMEGLQVYHYFRQYSFTEKHILSDKLTVVIRTHSRPKMFKRCIESVRAQTHKNIDIVVGVDNEESFNYAVKQNPTNVIRVESRERTSQNDFPANEYISKLIADITDGYILILDDDNYIADPKGVEKLFNEMDKEWCIYIIRYRYPDGRLFPNDRLFNSKVIEEGGVDWASCVFHSRFANITKSKPLYNADYHFINDLKNYAKTTKWINLDLVHTDTPGNNGKTEKEIKILPISSRKNDVVYVLGTGSTWSDNEIRFSIRSFVKYFEDLRNIVVVGECPIFINDVIHIHFEDVKTVNKDARMMMKIKAACRDPRVSDNFILCTDDTLLLSLLKFEDFKGWHDGPINYDIDTDSREHFGGNGSAIKHSEWYQYVHATGKELKKRNLPDNNFDRAHCPQPVNKAEFLQVMSEWDMVRNHYTVSNIYNNSSKIFQGKNISGKNLKIYSPVTKEQLDQLTDGKFCMNYNDNGLEDVLKEWLYARFNVASYHESFITDPNRRITVQKWIQGGCIYDDGVKIFAFFAPKNRHLIRYFELKKGSTGAEYKLKYTLQ